MLENVQTPSRILEENREILRENKKYFVRVPLYGKQFLLLVLSLVEIKFLKKYTIIISGGAYIPPARLRAMQAAITDKTSEQFQRLAWEALKKSINGLVNKVNVSNIINIVRELFQENIVRGR